MRTKNKHLSLFLGLPFLSSRKQKKISISTEASKKRVFLKKHPLPADFRNKKRECCTNVDRKMSKTLSARFCVLRQDFDAFFCVMAGVWCVFMCFGTFFERYDGVSDTFFLRTFCVPAMHCLHAKTGVLMHFWRVSYVLWYVGCTLWQIF